jgi:gluconate 2-dehydrogenase gamma chain
MTQDLSRRNFLSLGCSGVSPLWVSTHWPALLSAAKHARAAVESQVPPKLEFFTAEEALEIDSITSRIVPTDDTPGAHDAGVVYFIDRALTTFASDDRKTYREGLPEMQARSLEIFPSVTKFSAATHEQQDEILHSFDEDQQSASRPYRPRAAAQNFFGVLRAHTMMGFLLDPDSGGDPQGFGWKLIGRDREHMFQPPFGYYDKDYPGWQPAPGDEKKS